MRGLAALLAGRRRQARSDLPKTPRWAVYRAMAEMDGRGGLGRARSILAEAARADAAPAGVHFLVALAYHRAGQADVADSHLRKAIANAQGALHDVFAPDPAAGLTQAALAALRGLGDPEAHRLDLVRSLARAGRRGLVLQYTARLPRTKALRAKALALRARAWSSVGVDYAEDAAKAWLRAAPEAVQANLLVAEAALAEQRWSKARAALAAIDRAPKALAARWHRARARLALGQGDADEASEEIRAALRAAPKS